MTNDPTDPRWKAEVDTIELTSELIGFARTKASEARAGQSWPGTAALLDRLAFELYQSRTRELQARDDALGRRPW